MKNQILMRNSIKISHDFAMRGNALHIVRTPVSNGGSMRLSIFETAFVSNNTDATFSRDLQTRSLFIHHQGSIFLLYWSRSKNEQVIQFLENVGCLKTIYLHDDAVTIGQGNGHGANCPETYSPLVEIICSSRSIQCSSTGRIWLCVI
jgi:hypothetical protein